MKAPQDKGHESMIMKDTKGVFGRVETSLRHLRWMHVAMLVLLLAMLVIMP
jgi:hypothetical protein